jgi:hypothetical protein
MDGAVAVAADIDGLPHLIPAEPLLEPLVAVQRSGNEMMLGGATFCDPAAELTPLLERDGSFVGHGAELN